MNALRTIARKFGLASALRQMLVPLYNERVMRFPTFDRTLHKSLVPHPDYYRYTTLGLAVQTVLSESIAGSFAEVGVYRGEMSRFLHQLAPERPYYLFDTFEGFPSQDLEADSKNDARFRDTSVNAVLAAIGNTINVIVRQGYVPDTLAGLEGEQFAFVLLDVDLYAPTLRSLEFFYPRLTQGAYLVVHDYNSPESNRACYRAVTEFMRGKPEQPIEIADNWGTVMFRKI
jgi:O-methyltransferase